MIRKKCVFPQKVTAALTMWVSAQLQEDRNNLKCSSQSREHRTLACTIEPGDGRLYVTARRKKDGAMIRFGNVSDEQGRVFLGEITGRRESNQK